MSVKITLAILGLSLDLIGASILAITLVWPFSSVKRFLRKLRLISHWMIPISLFYRTRFSSIVSTTFGLIFGFTSWGILDHYGILDGVPIFINELHPSNSGPGFLMYLLAFLLLMGLFTLGMALGLIIYAFIVSLVFFFFGLLVRTTSHLSAVHQERSIAFVGIGFLAGGFFIQTYINIAY